MKRFIVETADGIEGLRMQDIGEPSVGTNDVKIRMCAASLNYRDLGVVSGGYLRNDTRPVVPLSDGAGVVAEVGAEVTQWKAGDRVSPNFVRDWISGGPTDSVLRTSLGGGVDGVLSELVVLPDQSIVAIPDQMTFQQAATIPCAAVTAWQALFHHGNLKQGETVLLLGTGGVSIFALQMAKASGATVIITSSSDEKLARAQSMGADHVVNYRNAPEWHKEVRQLTDGRGVDHVVEVGGPGTLERSLKSATVGGQVHLIGVLDSPAAKISPMLSVFNLIRINGIYVGSRTMHEQTLRQMTQGGIEPVIDKTFSFAESQDAYRYFAGQQHFGKVVVDFDAT